MDNGKLKKIGPAADVVNEYLESSIGNEENIINPLLSNESFYFRKVIIKNSVGDEVKILKPFETFTVELHYRANVLIEKPFFWIDVVGAYGHLFGASMIFDNLRPDEISGDGVISCRFSSVALLPQSYSVTLRVRHANGVDNVCPALFDAAVFQVAGSASDYGMTGELADQHLDHDTPMIVPYEWIYCDGSVIKSPIAK
jgi:hypothetical protein